MDEVEYKLKKRNAVLAVNAVSKLIDIIQSKGAPHSGKIEELPELVLLKLKCEDADPIVSITACQGVVTLVEVGILEVIPALSVFIATLPTVRNYTGVIYCIGTLLIVDLKARVSENKSYQCPFSLQSPQHPLVTVLKQNKDTWYDVLNVMKFICNHNEEIVAENSLELLHPVFLYALCDPSLPPYLPMACRQHVWMLLLKTSFNYETKDFLLKILSWLQVGSETEILSTSHMFLMMGEMALQHEDTPLCSALAPLLAALTHRLICHGHDPRSCLSTLSQLLVLSPDAGSCVVMLFSRTVGSCPVIYLKDLVIFCASVVEMKVCNAIATKMFVCALLQWLLYPSYMTGEALQTATSILTWVNSNTSWPSFTGRLCANRSFNQLQNTDSIVCSVIEMCRLAEAWQSNPAVVHDWLQSVTNIPQDISEHLQLFVSGLFIHNFDNSEIKQESLKLLLKMVERNNDFAASVMTFILYKLADEKEPLVQLQLLRGLTKMAVQKENVNIILHTLESLKRKQSMKTLLVDLYVQLWKVEIRCYPYLQKLLLENPIDGKDWKYDMSRALAIKEICETRPEQHGTELVKLLSQILNQCGSKEGGQSSALALQGITALCNAGIVNIATTWRALAPRLSRDKRPVVIKSLCTFFGCVLSMKCSGQEYEKLVSEVVIKLWSYVSTNKDVEVVSAALNILSKTDMEKLSLKTLPECYRQRLKLPSSYTKTPVDAARKPEDVLSYIPGECWIQLLQNMNSETLDAAGDMLAEWLSVELTSYHSSTYRTAAARGEPDNYSYLQHRSICRGITEYLQRLSQGTLEPSKIPVARQILRILSHNFPRILPPLNWTFLQQFLQQPDLCYYSLIIALKQASSSESGRRVIEMYLNSFDPSTENEEIIRHLFNHLGDLCKGIPPNSLKPFIEKSLNLAIGDSQAHEGDKQKVLLKDLLSQVKATLKRDDIHDANRAVLSILVEELLEKIDVNDKCFEVYVDCVTELTSKYLERMSSPSVWWEVTPHKLRKAVGIRGALARKADGGVPLVWMNECIDAAIDHVGEHTNVLQNAASVMSCIREHETNCQWFMELLGQIQNALNKKTNADNQQAIIFLCDVFLLTVIILSGYDSFVLTLGSIVSSRESRLLLFPQALLTLLSRNQWKAVAPKVMEWLYHMQNLSAVSPLYADTFHQGLMALRHDRYFKTLSVWMRFISCKPVKLQ